MKILPKETDISEIIVSESSKESIALLKVWRITALWGFSEAAFGGILHALNVPFRGLFISGAAVILISLLAYYSVHKDDIIKAAITVILIKALVSPHSPVNAYLAVLLQGAAGQILFYYKRFFKTSALLLGITAALLSAFQKLLVLTIIFGNTLWESMDIFIDFIITQFTADKLTGIRYSFILAGTYLGIHLLAGILFGIAAGRIPFNLHRSNPSIKDEIQSVNNEIFARKEKGKRKWWKRPSGIIIFLISGILVLLSYLTPLIQEDTAADIIIMLVRSIFIMFVWYTFLSPLVIRILNKVILKKQRKYASELTRMIDLFPQFRGIISYVWNKTSAEGGLKRIKHFLTYSFVFLLNYEEDIPAER